MKILHVLLTETSIPPQNYGGTERVAWALLLAQREMGHQVKFLVKTNSNHSDFAINYNPKLTMAEQVDGWADIVHFHWPFAGEIATPFICTEHSNNKEAGKTFPINTVYLSKKHAENHGAKAYVHNGLYWPDYGEPELSRPKNYLHFLAKASWRVKNLQGAVKIAQSGDYELQVLGGKRFNFKRNKYVYWSRKLHFHGMVGGEKKNQLVKYSKGLLFPVLWHEPFGLAIIESLYLGCPVFASPYGSLPDIINQENIGLLSDSYQALVEAVSDIGRYDRRACHEHAKMHFDHLTMAKNYQHCYERVLAEETLNPAIPTLQSNVKTLLKMSA